MAEKKIVWSPPQMMWSAALAVVLWSAVGFNWLGFGFGWNTQGGTAQAASSAVMGELATICVAQAKSSPDATAEIAKLNGLSTWKQRQFVDEAGWATMHGSKSSQGGVADLCATRLSAETEQPSE